MKSVMQHSFSRVPNAEIPRSSFDRSHGYKTTFDAGFLVPIFVDEVLPGDTFNLRMTALARMATPIFPIMDNLFMDSFFFFVPYRLVWTNWERFNGAQDDPDSSTDYLIPVIDTGATPIAEGGVADFMGMPVGVGNITPSALPFRAYQLIYNEWFRDQNLQDSVVQLGYGDAADTTYPSLRRRGKRHDYFTSCLPWPQKGDSVDLPLGTVAPINTDVGENQYITIYSTDEADYRRLDYTTVVDVAATGLEANRLYADLSGATAATINQLRQAFQIQKLLERDARGGTRYTEIVRAHFGVTSPDARLQRPEYLGGGSSRINISPIAQTSRTDTGETPLATLAAIGTGHINGHGFTKSFTEHGVIIGMVSVRADLTYQQGLNRMWSRQTRYDFYWPALAHIGEQAVLNQEIYAQGTSADTEVFGYQERYAEYRFKPSQITGSFRSAAAAPLDSWHLSQDFESLPALNSSFIIEQPPMDRVVAVSTEPDFLFDAYFDLRCARPMPMFGVPGLIDHF